MNRLRAYTTKAAVHRSPVGRRLRRYSEQAATPEWWKKLTKKAQDLYRKTYPGTKLKPTFRMPRPSTPDYDPIPPGEDPFQKQQDITHQFRLDHHIKQTLDKHGLGHHLLQSLKAALIGGLLATTALSNAYGGTTFDPNLPVIQISEQDVAERIPWLNYELVLKHFQSTNYLEQIRTVIRRPEVKNPLTQDFIAQEKTKLAKWKWTADNPQSLMIIKDVDKFVNHNIDAMVSGMRNADYTQRSIAIAVTKMNLIKDLSRGLAAEPNTMFLTIATYGNTDGLVAGVLVMAEDIGEWNELYPGSDKVGNVEDTLPNVRGVLYFINSTGVYAFDKDKAFQ